jgi:hypothetical protein
VRASARFFLSDSTDIVRQSPERADRDRATSRPTARARGDETTLVDGDALRVRTRSGSRYVSVKETRVLHSSITPPTTHDRRPPGPNQGPTHTAPNTRRTHRTHTRPHAAPALSGPCTQAPSGDSSEPIQSSSRIRRQGEPRRSLHSSRRSAERPRTRRGTPPDRGCRGGTTAQCPSAAHPRWARAR